MAEILLALNLVAAIGCGVVAGIFFAFSAFVMRALARLPAPQGIAAMQSINVVAVTPPLMATMFGTALACIVLVVSALLRRQTPRPGDSSAGGLFYLVGALGVTLSSNVPRNNTLNAVDAQSADGAAVWARYIPSWTVWNSVRTVVSLAASLAFILALMNRHSAGFLKPG